MLSLDDSSCFCAPPSTIRGRTHQLILVECPPYLPHPSSCGVLKKTSDRRRRRILKIKTIVTENALSTFCSRSNFFNKIAKSDQKTGRRLSRSNSLSLSLTHFFAVGAVLSVLLLFCKSQSKVIPYDHHHLHWTLWTR